MVKLHNRSIDDSGKVVYTCHGIIERLYEGKTIDNLNIENSDERDLYRKTSRSVGNKSNLVNNSYDINKWFTPEAYIDLDIEKYCLEKCKTQQERDRVIFEMREFKERSLEPVLRHLLYMVEEMRNNNCVWGVGRGSAVASYCLYLLGVHFVDSLKHNLDLSEFLK